MRCKRNEQLNRKEDEKEEESWREKGGQDDVKAEKMKGR